MNKQIKLTALTGLAFIMAACSSGSSSSGSNNNNDEGAAAPVNPAFVGTYRGGGPHTLTIPNAGSETLQIAVVVRINAEGNVSVNDGTSDINTSGQLNGDRFETSGSINISQDGVTCSGNISYNGTVRNENVSGAVASNNLTCRGGGNSLTARLEGNYSANKTSNTASARSVKSGGQGVADLIRQVTQ